MSETREDHEREARECLASRLDDLRRFVAYEGDPDEGPDDLGAVYDYGLSWDRESRNYRQCTVTYAHVLSTGGPHEEFRVTFSDEYPHRVEAVTFVYLPWFGRVELELDSEDHETAREFYDREFSEHVSIDEEQS